MEGKGSRAVDLREHPRAHVVRRERRAHGRRAPGRRRPASSRSEQVGRDGVLLVEGGAEHRRVVGVDRDRDPGVDEGRAAGAPRARPRRGSRRWTTGRPRGGIPVSARCASSAGSWAAEVPWPIRSAPSSRSDVPDRLRPGGLAGVRHAVQPGRAGRVEVRLELRPRHADLGTAEPEPDQRVDAVVEGVRRASRRPPAARSRRGCRRSSAAPGRSPARPRSGRPRSPRCRPRSGCPAQHRRVRRAGQLGVPDLLALGHLAGDLVGQVADVVGRADQVDDREVDLDEVGEVAEREERRAARRGRSAPRPGGARRARRRSGPRPSRRGGRAARPSAAPAMKAVEGARLTGSLAARRSRRCPGPGCISPSMKTPGVPLTPSLDIWSVALVDHCS